MRKKTKKAIFLAVLALFVGAVIVRAQFPQAWKKTTESLEEIPVVKKAKTEGGYVEGLDEVLGEKIEKVSAQVEEQQGLPVQSMVREVVRDSEIIKEIQTRVETKIVEKTREVQDLPQEALEEIRRQVREEFRRQVCEEWLTEEQ